MTVCAETTSATGAVPPVRFRRGALALAMAAAFASTTTVAGEKLDMSFIQGGAGINPEVWAALNGNYAPGRYLVDLSLNGKDIGKRILDVTPQDSEALCLTDAWLTGAGVYVSADYFREGYDATRQCYVLTKAPSAKVDFDVSTQSLALSIPQQGLVKMPENVEWDYGTDAFRVNYNANANTGRHNTSAFGSADLKANVGRWVVSSSATASTGDSGDNEATINMFTATRAIRSLSADLAVGKTSTGDNLLGSTGTYGVSLSRNNSMKPGNLGYTPVFSGIADGPSRVTLTQNGRMLYSEMVPAGPFSVTDVPLYTSGDVTMTVTGDDGREQKQVFPLSVMSGQLSPGEHEFSVAAGMPDDDSDLEGGVFAASYGYGLDGLTLRAGGVFNRDWQGASAGTVLGLGYLGAVSADGAYATAKYRDGSRSGNKVQLAWNKQLALTDTGLRVSWSRQSAEYEDMSSFNPAETWLQQNQGRRTKDEWNAGISQPVGGLFSLSVSGWQRSYYPASTTGSYRYAGDNGRDTGITGSLSTQIKGVSLNLGWSGSRNTQGENNWSASASVSVPFTLFDRKYSSSTSVSTGKDGGTGFSTGVSGSLNDRFSYGFGGGRDSGGGGTGYLNASYSGDRAYLSGTMNHSTGSGTSGSVSASGSVLAVPAARDVMFSRNSSDTVAVVNVKDTPGVKVTSGDGQTNGDGNLVVSLNSYDWNTVTIDAGTLPLNTELATTSMKVVPTDRAVVWMPFDALRVHRYLLQVKQRNGEFVPGGTWARDSKNTPLGFVANNGVLMINAVDRPGDITLGQCRIPAAKLQETEKLQEITCE
ncbi:outer membrane usher protein PefC [Salmonella enterica subsp. enterica serovar Newport]|uniref:Outer membrane usher protein PefC n=4 Tax=Salmonella enterica TaxID=28901 RepID=A0A3V2NZH1_SALET|nr:outer membrane usher protein PefC [Salmonella enterica subsp. enterica serovar Newport]EEP8451862.1 F4 (K88) fimbrial usher FaeD [Salmonella enterica subsp. enterica serovar Kasenyi]EBX0618329.1 outer membrane usher protein PefC [Salmonella enterica subsp. enterica serovar Newport]EBY0143265.1 outer membrane usher protein PefC [Salmonella enterica subsp. enterica serovar Newport]ECB3848913.1 outer membrane usher protein PefC [Salmonella enterica subsp. enterica serovar Newport]